ncbi:unnamed protein product [Musa acuminata subsp. malaccensis]|uniref:(wild Malaysian banana) hypothetical protein n=1 Tax=Musa acuminata subsp. malaccensis TaxID=214687 RepID=A0A804IW69_MUSAM|nr:unnamed protein product [Musa acuminata subsp. malaccensis]
MTSTSFLKDKAKAEGKGEGTYLAYAAQKQRRNEDKAQSQGRWCHSRPAYPPEDAIPHVYICPPEETSRSSSVSPPT